MCCSRLASALAAPCKTLCVTVCMCVAGRDRAMQRRGPDGEALRQVQLEFAQARKAQRAAEANDRRRADLRPARQRVDIGAHGEIRIREHDRGDLLLPLRQRLGALAHREQKIAHGTVELAAAFGRASSRSAVQKNVRIAPVTR